MITSLKLTGTYNIGMRNNKIEVDGNILDTKKEIPFFRYALGEMDDTKINYIKSMKEKFSASTHLVEITADENPNVADKVTEIRNSIESVAVYAYFNITDDNVSSGKLAYTLIEELKALKSTDVDRIMFKDKTTTLDTVTAQNLIKQAVRESGFPASMFGICSSPLSFGENACLTAIKARELMSTYSSISDVALPSANHQCMNCCGCIRYIKVNSDLEAPPEKEKKSSNTKKVKNATNTSSDSEKKSAKKAKATKSKATVVIPGQFNL